MHFTIRERLRLVLFVLATFSCSSIVFAQVPPPTDLNLDTGMKPYETYDRAQENVNIGSGNLNIQIPLIHLPGRNGHGFDLTLTYNSQNWTPVASAGQLDPVPGYGSVPDPSSAYIEWRYETPPVNSIGSTGWQYNIPTLFATGVPVPPSCVTQASGCLYVNSYSQSSSWTDFVLVMGDGRKYEFPYVSFYNYVTTTTQGGPGGTVLSTSPSGSADGLLGYDYPANPSPSGWMVGGGGGEGVLLDLTGAASGVGAAVVRFRDGTQILFPITSDWQVPAPGGPGPANASGSKWSTASEIVDSNGNIISFGGSCNNATSSVVATSSTGNCIVSINNGLKYWDSNGNPQTISLAYSGFGTTFPGFCMPATNASNLSNSE